MIEKRSIKVDLDLHTVERLTERSPNFRIYDNSLIITELNDHHSSAVLYKRKHRDIATHELAVITLFGSFLLSENPGSDIYFAETFKILPKFGRTNTGASEDVQVQYSIDKYLSLRELLGKITKADPYAGSESDV